MSELIEEDPTHYIHKYMYVYILIIYIHTYIYVLYAYLRCLRVENQH